MPAIQSIPDPKTAIDFVLDSLKAGKTGDDAKAITTVRGTLVGQPEIAATQWGPLERLTVELAPDSVKPGQPTTIGLSMNLEMAKKHFEGGSEPLRGAPMDVHPGDTIVAKGELAHGLPGGFMGGTDPNGAPELCIHWTHASKNEAKHESGFVQDLTTKTKYD